MDSLLAAASGQQEREKSESAGPSSDRRGGPRQISPTPEDGFDDMQDAEDAQDNDEAGQPRQKSKRGRKSAKTSYAQRHQAAEARRRNRINERIEALRKLVPNDPRSNTASFLEDVIKHILSLQDNNEKLERVLRAFSEHQQQQQQQQREREQQQQQREREQQQQQQQQQQRRPTPSLEQQLQSSAAMFGLGQPIQALGGLHLPANPSLGLATSQPLLSLPAPDPPQLQSGLPLQSQLLLLQAQQHHQQQHQEQQQQQHPQLQQQQQTLQGLPAGALLQGPGLSASLPSTPPPLLLPANGLGAQPLLTLAHSQPEQQLQLPPQLLGLPFMPQQFNNPLQGLPLQALQGGPIGQADQPAVLPVPTASMSNTTAPASSQPADSGPGSSAT